MAINSNTSITFSRQKTEFKQNELTMLLADKTLIQDPENSDLVLSTKEIGKANLSELMNMRSALTNGIKQDFGTTIEEEYAQHVQECLSVVKKSIDSFKNGGQLVEVLNYAGW